jgi:hypothetical protein
MQFTHADDPLRFPVKDLTQYTQRFVLDYARSISKTIQLQSTTVVPLSDIVIKYIDPSGHSLEIATDMDIPYI